MFLELDGLRQVSLDVTERFQHATLHDAQRDGAQETQQ